MYYGILSWLQPALVEMKPENLIVHRVPPWVAALTHLVFGWTIGDCLSARRLSRPTAARWNKHERREREHRCPPSCSRHDDLVEERLVMWYFLAALGYLFVSMMGGLIMALQLVHWNPHDGDRVSSPGRWRMIHTNAIAYGFIANAFSGRCIGRSRG